MNISRSLRITQGYATILDDNTSKPIFTTRVILLQPYFFTNQREIWLSTRLLTKSPGPWLALNVALQGEISAFCLAGNPAGNEGGG